MRSPGEDRLDLFLRDYNPIDIGRKHLSVYQRENVAPRAFASIHERLDGLLRFMNTKAPNGQEGHFNAGESRELLGLIDEVKELSRALKGVGQGLVVHDDYRRVLEEAVAWLQPSGGSLIPAGFTPVEVDSYAPMFWREDMAIELRAGLPTDLKSVGEGAFATVQRFVDINHDITLARKKLKANVDERERDRFRREFYLMKELNHPYILEVHKFHEATWSYTMEYCESTLHDYVTLRNNDSNFGFGTRQRIALQFLYGLNYLHLKGHMHRDLSPRNVLLKVHDMGAVTVKLADFGLTKHRDSDFTTTDSEMKGTVRDPALESFKDFGPVNDIYSAGFVLSFIFTGRQRAITGDTELSRVIHRCIDAQPSRRFQTVPQLIKAVETLQPPPRTPHKPAR